MTLRTRWALTSAVIAALTIGLAILAALAVTSNQLRREVDQDLRQRIVAVPADLRELLGRSFRPFGNRQPPLRFDAVIQVVTEDGTTIAFDEAPALPVGDAERRLAEGPGQPVLRTVDVDGAPHRMITAHVSANQVSGAIQIAVDISSIDRSLLALRRRLVLVWLAASGAAAAAGWLTARRAMVPVETLTSTAERIAATSDLDAGDVGLDTDAPAEIGRLASAFTSMLNALRQSRDQQRRLTSDAGHELRTPLTALRTNLETLRRRDADLTDEQRTELLDAAIEEVGELSSLSAELVQLASDAGSEEPMVEVDLFELAVAVADRFRRRSSQQISVTGAPARVRARAGQIDRAISNLVDNAFKWSSGEVSIAVDGTSVSVRDDGPGIPETDLPHVFERFYRAVGARSTPGSGLGLAIVEAIVAGHGGTVRAENHPDGGAVVGFTLPSA